LIERAANLVSVDHSRVIFVTGLPRSGSTLVEQILVSHPDVHGGEELGLVRLLAQDIGGADAASFAAWLDRGGDPNDLVRLYLRLASERMGAEGRFVDKTLDPAGSMGLLMALFPSAPIFWMRRDPIDNGWSAFRTYFARGVDWSYDLTAIGHKLGRDERLFARWSAEWPDRITPVDYAALVDNPDDGIERIARAAKLDLHADQLAPHLTQRVVTTASVRQVREPINRKGLGVAEPYRPWLGTMIDAYRSKNGPYPNGSK
jgi:hypothetical protein